MKLKPEIAGDYKLPRPYNAASLRSLRARKHERPYAPPESARKRSKPLKRYVVSKR